jgi:hypothetical protein
VSAWPAKRSRARGGTLAPPRAIAAGEVDQIVLLGQEFLTFLAATVVVVPLCNRLKISPILGFLLSGVLLDQTGCAPRRATQHLLVSPCELLASTRKPPSGPHSSL